MTTGSRNADRVAHHLESWMLLFRDVGEDPGSVAQVILKFWSDL